ncbi:ATP synthase subunit b, mitochondrial-like [Battus philenor]|uniref:ATP synthase subunit b, mitochondrial-like n=1 Tax=Battus philenor TaxID=42288 RepID=UPI0035D13065
MPKAIFASHTKTCPVGSKKDDGNAPLKRAMKSGKVRFGFIPDECFKFFYTKTGVTGPYLFGIMLLNYAFSKEIYVMEHEYYCGLSILAMVYFATKKLGPSIAASLDEQVDEVEAKANATRKQEETFYEDIVKDAKDKQMRANGQKLLMDAKKENVAMQLEAAYRERLMQVYRTVKKRMDYHMKRYRVETQIQQKWMTTWILNNVIKAITPDIEKKAMDQAIADLSAIADRIKK